MYSYRGNRLNETIGALDEGGILMSQVCLKKMAMSHVIVSQKISMLPLANEEYPCHMSLAIVSPMSPVEFENKNMLFVTFLSLWPVDFEKPLWCFVDFTKLPCPPCQF